MIIINDFEHFDGGGGKFTHRSGSCGARPYIVTQNMRVTHAVRRGGVCNGRVVREVAKVQCNYVIEFISCNRLLMT